MNDVKLDDEKALEYMSFAARISNITFKDDAELLSFRNDFNQALKFISILDTVDIKGVEPLGNVLEYYGGNSTKMRSEADFARIKEDETNNIDFQSELKKMNKHYKDGYVVLPKPKSFNPDCE